MSKQKKTKVTGKLVRDLIVSIFRGRPLVGVYWKGTDGIEILFETSPKKANAIIKIFNSR